MRYAEIAAMTLYITGTVVAFTRYTSGLPEDADTQHIQALMEFMCMLGLILFLLNTVSKLKKTNVKTLLQFVCLLGLVILVTVAFPETSEDPSKIRGIGSVIILCGMFGMAIGGQYYAEHKRRKEHPDGFYNTFERAMKLAKQGNTVESQTGMTIRMGGDGHLVFDAPLEPKDLESMWREVSTDGEGSS